MKNFSERSPSVIALDVGGSSVKSAVVTADAGGEAARFVSPPMSQPIDSGATAAAIITTLAEVIRARLAELAVDATPPIGIGIGFPGPFDYAAGISHIQGVAKFEALYGLDVAQALAQQIMPVQLPIRFRNDAEAAIVGEALYGAGRPFARLIGVTLGTGCGSAFLVNGRPLTHGPGVPPNGWLYPILFHGRQADDLFSIRGLLAALHAAGVEAQDIAHAATMAKAGDTRIRGVFARFGRDLGEFLCPWAEEFQAQTVLLQGGIANAFDLFEADLHMALPVRVFPGRLGAKAALLGAAALFLSPASTPAPSP